MRRQGLQGRRPKHRKGLTRQDAKAPKFPDLVHRDFTAMAPNVRWCGDVTEIPTDEGKLYLATVLDLFSRKLLACPTSAHPDAELVCDAIKIATAVRGGRAPVDGVVFHTDRGSTYTARSFTGLCEHLAIHQSMGRVGSCFDNAAARRRSSPPWSTRCCPGTISPPGLRLAPSWSPGALTSTTPDGA
jgi:putative transposase